MRILARITSLALVAGVVAVVPAGPASAVTGNLNTEPETSTGATTSPASEVELTATVMSAATPPAPVAGANVHYRYESGPVGTNPPTGGTNGIGQLLCTTDETGTCKKKVAGPTSGAGGKSVIRTWVENDSFPGPTLEADTDEPADETKETPPEPATGNDNTDVVEITWTPAPAGLDLNVEPEEQEQPVTPPGGSRSAAAGEATFTAAVVEDGEPASGKKVNFEVIEGPNAGTTFDCTTATAGTCEATYPGGPDAGTDKVRGVIDGETADETEGRDEATEKGGTDEADGTDVVEVTWTTDEPPPPSCIGTAEDDILVGTEEDDTCNGGAGNDTIRSLGGNDTVKGGGGDDKLILGDGNDSGNGGAGKDVVKGQDGNDDVSGGGGREDKVVGGAGRDDCNAETERSCE